MPRVAIGNQAFLRVHASRNGGVDLASSASDDLLVRRAIDANNSDYVRDQRRVRGGAGSGKIVGSTGTRYVIELDSGRRLDIEAQDLDLIEDEADVAEASTSDVAAADRTPAELRVVQNGSKNSWSVTLTAADGALIAHLENVKKGVVEVYVRKKGILTDPLQKAKNGVFAVKPGAELKGQLKAAEEKQTAEYARTERLAALQSDRLRVAPGDSTIDQTTLFERLQALQSAKVMTGQTGNASIMMTKIRLDRSVTLIVAGVEREITRLYTQPGNRTEIRCYLGNDRGAYQRVHTSITVMVDEPPSAHTMVQTGAEVAVPNVRGGGPHHTRIGFDSRGGGR